MIGEDGGRKISEDGGLRIEDGEDRGRKLEIGRRFRAGRMRADAVGLT